MGAAGLIGMLDSPYMLSRQFTMLGLEEMLEIKLSDYGYEFYMFRDERRESLKALWADFVTDDRPFPEKKTASQERIRHYEKLIKFNPGSYMAHHQLGVLRLNEGDANAALAHFRRTVELKPDFADGHHNIGVLLVENGDVDQAIRHFRECLRIAPNHAKLHHVLGGALGNRGSVDQAIEHFHAALRINPDFKRGA